jgi:uncharacterized cupredoxin-like copper-binding protein
VGAGGGANPRRRLRRTIGLKIEEETATVNNRSARGTRGRSGRLALLSVVALATGALGAAGVAAAAGPAGASTKATSVTAVETEFHIKLSKTTYTPGRYTFVAENKGHVTHSLEITGPGLSSPHTKNLNPGQSARLTVTFKKGTYDVFCPVPGHKMLGMNVNLGVGVSTTGAKPAGSM